MEREMKHMNADNGEYTVRHSRLSTVVAAVCCLILAFLVWIAVMNASDTKRLPLVIVGGDSEYTYTLSDVELEVRGSVLYLKKAEKIEIVVPEEANAPGTYAIALEKLVLPEGVSLSELTGITLTVSET